MFEQPMVSVVALSYNRPYLLAEALQALHAQTYANLEIIVIDNRSPASDAVARIVAQFPRVRLVRNPTNLGFSGGMNVGLRQARGEFVCLTEDDLVLEPDYVANLVAYLASHPDTGIASGVLYNYHARTVCCAGADFRLGMVFRFTFLAEGEPDASRFSAPFAVQFVSGSMIFGKRQFLLEELNGFREDFFLYFEDLDLCHRARRAGKQIMIVPRAKGYHHEPLASAPSDVAEYHKLKNLFAIYFLHAPMNVLPAFVLRYGLVALLKSLLSGRRRDFVLQCKALAYVLPRIPSLWRQRRSHA